MHEAVSDELGELLSRQAGVLSRKQALAAGLAPSAIDNRLRSGRWQQLQRGVYATFTGIPGRDALCWAALLRSGPSAVLSHQTAAEYSGLMTAPSPRIHVTVASVRRVDGLTGVILHRSEALARTTHPAALPPRTRVEDTVLDLTQTVASFDDAFGWLSRAVGRRLTTPERLRAAMQARSRVRWRQGLSVAIGDIGAGVHSPLELRYVTKVERAHGLPAARRQACVVVGGHRRYVDNLYEEAELAVELDGLAVHPPEQRWADNHRDNEIAGLGILTLHYTWRDVDTGACVTAGQVGALLTMRGARVTLRKCGPACPVTSSVVARLAS